MRSAGPLPKILLAGVALLLLALAPGCGGCGSGEKAPTDPTAGFRPEGEARVNELGLYVAGARVGTLGQRMSRGKWSGILSGEAVLLDETVDITVGYQEQRFTIHTVSRMVVRERDHSLLAAWSEASFGAAPWVVTWEKASEEMFVRAEWAGGSTRRDNIPLPRGTLVLEALPYLLGHMGFEAGESRSLDLYSLTIRKPVSVTVSLQGESQGSRTFSFTMWAMEEKVWIDSNGMVVKESLPLDIQARPPSLKDSSGVLRLETILAQSAVPGVNTPERIADLPKAHLVLEGVGALPVETPWQRVTAARRGAELDLIRPVPPPDGGNLSALKPGGEAVLDLGSPYIQQVARQAVGSATTPWDKAVSVGRWVYSNLGKTMRECTSALDALRAGEGECQSHAVLASALCQSAGIPTRFVSGIVYLPQRGNWFFHAWLEVNVGEWIPIDPTLGAFPAGVDHVALVYGNYLDQFQMAPFLFFGRPWRVVYEEPGSAGPPIPLREPE